MTRLPLPTKETMMAMVMSMHNSDMTRVASTDNAVQKDPDAAGGPPPADPNDIEIERFVYENVPSTGYVGTPLTNLDYTGGRRATIGGPDGTSFVFAEEYDTKRMTCSTTWK